MDSNTVLSVKQVMNGMACINVGL